MKLTEKYYLNLIKISNRSMNKSGFEFFLRLRQLPREFRPFSEYNSCRVTASQPPFPGHLQLTLCTLLEERDHCIQCCTERGRVRVLLEYATMAQTHRDCKHVV